MNVRDKKLAVLNQLGQESEPVSLPYLLAKLDKGFVERSVRRWLTELVNEGLVQKLGFATVKYFVYINCQICHFIIHEIECLGKRTRRQLSDCLALV